MKIKDAVIYAIPIEHIDTVYLIGKSSDYYRLYLEQHNNCIVRIDLKKTLEHNFNKFHVVNSVHIGNLTKKLKAKKALELLMSCNWESEIKPNIKTLNIVKNLLKVADFKPFKREVNKNLPFFFWLKNQTERDDLIGDLAYDFSEDTRVGSYKTYKELKSYISFNQTDSWDINSFRDSKKKFRGVPTVSPLLCLKLAKMEFDINQKKEKLKVFRVPKTKGYVYFLKPKNKKNPIKIGRARNIKQRISQLQTSLPYDLELIGYINSDDYIKLESQIQEIFKKNNIKREWFDIQLSEVKEIIEKYSGIITNEIP